MNIWVFQSHWQGREATLLANLYLTPFQAETFIKGIYPSAGYTYSVRPATWQEREERMFCEGGYSPPVWSSEMWWQNVAHLFETFYVHISLRDPTSVAFTEDERKGEADRQTAMRPGKFLQKFLGAGPAGTIEHGPMKGEAAVVSKQQVAYYAAWHQSGKRPPNEDVLKFTEDPDMMVHLYENGPDSCMMGKGWSTEHHPVRVYAGGDLALAYMEDINDPDTIVGRALCWPAKGRFGRVYPTPNSSLDQDRYDELEARLKALGWTSICEDRTVFEGARLAQVTDRYGDYVMPYLDYDYGVREVFQDGRSYWVMTHDEPHQDNTDGTLNEENSEPDWRCDNCEDGFSDDDGSWSVYRSWSPPALGRTYGYARGEASWCCSCRDDYAFYCDGSDEHYVDRGDQVCANDGLTYERHWFEANGGWRCAHSEEYYFEDSYTPVRLADGSTIHADHADEQTFVCLYTGLRWLKDDESKVTPGYHQDFDSWLEHPLEQACVMPSTPKHPADMQAWAQAQAFEPIAPATPHIAA